MAFASLTALFQITASSAVIFKAACSRSFSERRPDPTPVQRSSSKGFPCLPEPRVSHGSKMQNGHFNEPSARDRTMRDVFQGFRALGRTVDGPRTALGLAVLRDR